MRLLFNSAFLLFAAFIGQAASAQYQPPEGFFTVPIEFNGVITSSITDEITVVDRDGNAIPYTGPVPDYPFNTGDLITIGFDAIVPTGETISAGLVPASADGIYRFEISPPTILPDFPENASFTNLRGNGGITDNIAFGDGGNLTSGFVMVYDANSDQYSLDFVNLDAQNPFAMGFFDGPMLRYDVDQELLTTVLFSDLFDTERLNWVGTGANTAFLDVGILSYSGDQLVDTQVSPIFFEGGWNIPLFGRSDPVQVPEPPIVILFGIAAAGLIARRKRVFRAAV